MFKAIVILCVLLAAGVVFFSLGHGDGAAAGEKHLVFNNGPEVNALDPQVISWKHDIRIANALFEGLMSFRVLPPETPGEPGEVTVVKGAAADFSLSEDALVYTFTLDSRARWSDGDPLTAEDFAWSFRRLMTPMTAGDYAQMMFVIRGARAYYQAILDGRPADFERVGVKALDPATLEITLEAPCGYFLELLAFPPFFPVKRSLLEQFPLPDGPEPINGVGLFDAAAWTRPGVLVGNGPFVLAEHLPRHRLELRRNPEYRDAASVRLDAVTALAIDDNNAALNAYESGRCDLIDIMPASFVRSVLQQSPQQRRGDFYSVRSYGTYYYRLNCQGIAAGGAVNPLADPRVRRALAMAVDKDELVAILGGGQTPAASFVPPGLTVRDARGRSCDYPHIEGLPCNVDAARALLAEAGYPGGAGLDGLVLLYNSGNDHELLAQRLRKVWLEGLGVDVRLEGIDANAFGQALKKPEDKRWHLARSAWFGDYRDPTSFLDMFITGNGNNDSGFSDARYDALLAEAAATADQPRRMALLAEAERIVVEQTPAALPLYHYAEHYLIRPRVGGVYPNTFGYVLLGQAWLED